MEWIKTIIRRARGGERGASAVEYGLLIAAVASVMVAAVYSSDKPTNATTRTPAWTSPSRSRPATAG